MLDKDKSPLILPLTIPVTLMLLPFVKEELFISIFVCNLGRTNGVAFGSAARQPMDVSRRRKNAILLRVLM